MNNTKIARLRILNEKGLHARAAAKFVELVDKFDVNVVVKKDGLEEKSNELYENLRPFLNVTKDEKDAIGRRYRRQDAIGTPVCITIDHDTLKDNSVTFRLRDTMEQYRVDLSLVRDELFKLTNPAHFLHKK